MGENLPVKVTVLLNFKSILFNIFYTRKYDGYLLSKAILITIKLTVAEISACKSLISALPQT